MANDSFILPLESLEGLSSRERLIDPSHFDDEEHEPTRLAIDQLEAGRHRVLACIETAYWYDRGLTRWATGECKELGDALGLPPSVRKSIGYKMQTGHLRDALALVHCEKPGIKARAKSLSDEIRRFEVNYGDAMPAEPLPNWSRSRRCVWRARQFGALPKSWKRIAERCNRSR